METELESKEGSRNEMDMTKMEMARIMENWKDTEMKMKGMEKYGNGKKQAWKETDTERNGNRKKRKRTDMDMKRNGKK